MPAHFPLFAHAFLATSVGTGCQHYEAVEETAGLSFETGAHIAVSCAGCHPTDPATSTITTCVTTVEPWTGGCLQCHECDRGLHPDDALHFPDQDCADCHDAGGTSWADLLEGTLPGESSCAGACHGATRGDAAPIGDAHAAHLDASTVWLPPGTCEMCHPSGGASAPTHADGWPTLTFDHARSRVDDQPVVYDNGTCAGTYCHGASLREGDALPAWRRPRPDRPCEACHGNGPRYDGHPDDPACSDCHAPTGGSQESIEDGHTHIDQQLHVYGGVR